MRYQKHIAPVAEGNSRYHMDKNRNYVTPFGVVTFVFPSFYNNGIPSGFYQAITIHNLTGQKILHTLCAKLSWSHTCRGALVSVTKKNVCTENVWEFHIGGYQVCEKWLKDRKGRTLSNEDIEHYHRIVVALNETIRLMSEIDKVIDEHGGWPIK